jgi:hypothetical protein
LIPATDWGNINKMNALWGSRKKIIGLGAIALLAVLMVNINSRLGEYFHLTSERDKLAAYVGGLRATMVQLTAEKAYAMSDGAVEDWARGEAHMARPGDKVVSPYLSQSTPQAAKLEPTPTPSVSENYQVWWALFFSK